MKTTFGRAGRAAAAAGLSAHAATTKDATRKKRSITTVPPERASSGGRTVLNSRDTTAPCGSPKSGYAVGVEGDIRGYKRHPLGEGSGRKEPVERVAVVQRQRRQQFNVGRFQRQQVDVVGQ